MVRLARRSAPGPPPGLDARKLRANPPDAFVLSEFDVREELRLGDASAEAFLEELDRIYPDRHRFQGIPKGFRAAVSGGLRPVPHDWLYPFADLWLYRRTARNPSDS